MNPRSKTLGAALAVIGLLAVSLYAAIFASAGLPGSSRDYVTVRFSDVGGLREGDDVREASVRVGRVDAIDLDGDEALVRLQLSGDKPVYADATAAVWARSGLGQNFVELNRGHADAGDLEGEELPPTQTLPASQLDDLLSVLDRPTREGLASTLREVGGGVEGQSAHLAAFLTHAPELLGDLGAVSTATASQRADLAGLLDASSDLASRFRGREDHVESLLGKMDTTLQALDADHGRALRQTLEKAPAALEETGRGLASLEQPLINLEAAARSLEPGAAALGRSTPALRAVLRGGQKPLERVPGVADLAEPAVGELATAVGDVRPVTERLEGTFTYADVLASYMSPYARDISQFFDYWHSANGNSDKLGHYLRLGLIARPESIDGILPIADPFTHRNPYPAPGTAQLDRSNGLLGGN
ncbi:MULTISPECIES: MlaD family protein [unclassified Nocardioides]|uniref:MlaD family protein n=1 Tax=unclassified Nocardioides TaxID=2615069 RepID=UPI0007025861|nr:MULTISPECIES: MlaD family protein [unclassified Nocardioides]KRC46461.1 hypothetical protein ASE19_21805 [Nocardioides sp. Root79]KRC69805.1 hypothetical protein ASE20_14655 [Nocardioides sp. Root240]